MVLATTCKECGAAIIFALNIVTGKRVPLIAKRTTAYRLNEETGECTAAKELVFVSHYLNCPGASKFNKGMKAE